jgi:hypothetical protein
MPSTCLESYSSRVSRDGSPLALRTRLAAAEIHDLLRTCGFQSLTGNPQQKAMDLAALAGLENVAVGRGCTIPCFELGLKKML